MLDHAHHRQWLRAGRSQEIAGPQAERGCHRDLAGGGEPALAQRQRSLGEGVAQVGLQCVDPLGAQLEDAFVEGDQPGAGSEQCGHLGGGEPGRGRFVAAGAPVRSAALLTEHRSLGCL
ncbi:hypothetical protein GCM10018952_57560 [Streptosporangium vulgare]